jgi:actin-related protein 3
VTHVVPIVNGYVVGPAIQSMPLAGSTITSFIAKRLEERGESMLQNKKISICRCV